MIIATSRIVIDWELEGRMDTCIRMVESVHCSPDTITTLLTGYTSKQIKKFFFKKEWKSSAFDTFLPCKT